MIAAPKLSVLDLFSGIGGFSLGLEATGGFETVGFCEIEIFPFRLLMQHWPEVPIYDDVCALNAEVLAADGVKPNVLCGGFPCQDISLAGNGSGIEGARSGLWWEYHRLIDEIRPRWAVIENVSALRSRGLGTVLWSLSQIGYDAEWYCIPASAVGAPHRRDRIWIVAYPDKGGERALPLNAEARGAQTASVMADADEPRLERWLRRELQERSRERLVGPSGASMADAGRNSAERHGSSEREVGERDWWFAEPDVGRVAYGVPARVDRLRALGNAVVPQLPYIIGRSILAWEAAQLGVQLWPKN